MEAGPSLTPIGKSKTKGDQKRFEILYAIRSFIQSRKEEPTVQDIQEMTRIRSFNTVSRHLIKLKDYGIIEWEPGSPLIKLKE